MFCVSKAQLSTVQDKCSTFHLAKVKGFHLLPSASCDGQLASASSKGLRLEAQLGRAQAGM